MAMEPETKESDNLLGHKCHGHGNLNFYGLGTRRKSQINIFSCQILFLESQFLKFLKSIIRMRGMGSYLQLK